MSVLGGATGEIEPVTELEVRYAPVTAAQEKHLVQLWNDGTHTTAELADLFDVGRSTVYRAIQRSGNETKPATKRSQNAAT